MTTPNPAATTDRPHITNLIPGGSKPGPNEWAVAGIVLVSLGALYGFRKGIKGIGDMQLSGSAVRGVEFAAYLMIVGATIRTLQTQFPKSAFAKAVNYIY